MHVASSMNLNSAVSLTNSGTLTVDQSSTVNGRFVNTGVAQIAGSLTVNGSGPSSERVRDLTDRRPQQQRSLLDEPGARARLPDTSATTEPGASRPSGTLDSATLSDDGHVTGFGRYHFSGTTSVQGSFVGDSSSAPIVVDSTAPPGQIFDVQTGTVANVVRGTVGRFTICGRTRLPTVRRRGPQPTSSSPRRVRPLSRRTRP